MKITTIGIDLAKNVFQIHGVDERGKTVLKKQIKREQMAPFLGVRAHGTSDGSPVRQALRQVEQE